MQFYAKKYIKKKKTKIKEKYNGNKYRRKKTSASDKTTYKHTNTHNTYIYKSLQLHTYN